jgi:hypothetical protein
VRSSGAWREGGECYVVVHGGCTFATTVKVGKRDGGKGEVDLSLSLSLYIFSLSLYISLSLSLCNNMC